MTEQANLVQIATLKKPYGIKGWLWVMSLLEERSDIFELKEWYMKTATGFKPLTVSDWRVQGAGLIASFVQVPDRNVAERMVGTTIWVNQSSLPKASDDEYYWSELIGLKVFNTSDECLGAVHSLFETGAHDILVLRPSSESIDDNERLIPWHAQTVLQVVRPSETETGKILVDWERDY